MAGTVKTRNVIITVPESVIRRVERRLAQEVGVTLEAFIEQRVGDMDVAYRAGSSEDEAPDEKDSELEEILRGQYL